MDRFPQLNSRVDATFGSYYDLRTEIPQAYPVFEDVLQHSIFEILNAPGDDPFLKDIFAFCEEMAASEDEEVVNLLWIAILEPLVFSHERTRRAWKYMGTKTRALATDLARLRGWEKNLPSDEPS